MYRCSLDVFINTCTCTCTCVCCVCVLIVSMPIASMLGT